MEDRNDDLRRAFDGQAERFERSPLQSDPGALARLVAFAALPPRSLVLDAGCGPGLVAEALLQEGHRVVGVDLSSEMVRRARDRCVRYGDRAAFVQASMLELTRAEPFDAALSRLVLHHVDDPLAFLRAAAGRVRAGGVVVVSDHSADPDLSAARWHQEIERGRDRTHAGNLTPGQIVDLFAAAGLSSVSLVEEPMELDFDEWFDRGTPQRPKAEVRAMLLGGRARGFAPRPLSDGRIAIGCLRALVRGIRP